jgi:hypothetical protein
MSAPLTRKNLPAYPTPDDILNVFLEYLSATDTEPYDHQEEAILELFAGIAITHDATLLTRNTVDFAQVPGLRFENWLD